jgi:hypothetical protein
MMALIAGALILSAVIGVIYKAFTAVEANEE